MKTILTIFCFFIFCLNLSYAQSDQIEYIISEHPHAKVNKVIHANGKTFLGGSIYSCDQATVFAFDSQGEIEWSITTDGYSRVDDMAFRASDSILIITNSWATADDYTTELDGPNILGIDWDGNIVFEIHLSDLDYGGQSSFSKFTINANNEIVICNNNNIFFLDSLGNFLSSKVYPDYSFKHIESYEDSILFLTTNSNLVIANESGEIQSTLTLNAEILGMELDGETLLFPSFDHLHIYDIPNQSLSFIEPFFLNPTGVTADDNWIYLWGTGLNTPDLNIIERWDKGFSYIDFISLENDPLSISDISTDESQLYIVGNKKMNQDSWSPLDQAFIKTTLIFEGPSYDSPNISLSNFQVVEPAIISYFDSMEYIYFYDNLNMIFEYDITNEGDETIFSYTLVSQELAGFNCSRVRYFRHFENLAILPGETITMKDSINSFLTQYFNEFELTAFAPNHLFDGNAFDNFIVGDDDFTTTSICDCLPEISLSLFPNPTSNELNIVFENVEFSNQKKIRIINLDGKIVKEQHLILGKNQYSINVKNYPVGVYFFQYLKNGETAKSEKIVIHR